MGPYCAFCDHRCFVERHLPDGESLLMATCPKGMDHDRSKTGHDHTTATNPSDQTEPETSPVACDQCDAFAGDPCTFSAEYLNGPRPKLRVHYSRHVKAQRLAANADAIRALVESGGTSQPMMGPRPALGVATDVVEYGILYADETSGELWTSDSQEMSLTQAASEVRDINSMADRLGVRAQVIRQRVRRSGWELVRDGGQ